jgi:hypothetical protein
MITYLNGLLSDELGAFRTRFSVDADNGWRLIGRRSCSMFLSARTSAGLETNHNI